MTRFISQIWAVLLLLALSLTTQAQDKSYPECVRAIIKVNGSSINAKDMSDKLYTAFTAELKQNGQDSQENLDQLKSVLDKYFDENFINDMVNIMVPYYERHCTLADLNTCAQLMHEPATRSAIEHVTKVSNDQTNLVVGIMSMMDKNFTTLPSKMSADYKAEIDRYAQLANISTMTDNLKSAFLNTQGSDEQTQQIIKRIFDNFTTLLGNTLYENHVTIDELRTINTLYARPEYAGITKATNEFTSEIMLVSQKLIGNIVMYLSKNMK